jgi:hypothetical protein
MAKRRWRPAYSALQGRVEGRGLAGAGRICDQNDAVRLGQQLAQGVDVLDVEPEALEIKLDPRAVKDAHHHALAEYRGYCRNAKVDVDTP